MSVSKRVTSMASGNSPGPGSYNYRTTLSGPNWGFGSTARSVSYERPVPGPGSYNFNPANSKVSYSFVPRRPLVDSDKAPGPGTYDSRKNEYFPKFTIGKSKRPDLAKSSDLPGPGAYSPQLPNSNAKNVCNL